MTICNLECEYTSTSVLISFAVFCETVAAASRFSSAADAEFRGTEGLTEQPIRHNVHTRYVYDRHGSGRVL